MAQLSVNDWVIYHQPEASTHPRSGARDVQPAELGEMYSYVIDHFLRVIRVNADGTIDAVGRSGRVHRLTGSDPLLEKAGWWNRLARRRLFSSV
jgi:hypothetical protein